MLCSPVLCAFCGTVWLFELGSYNLFMLVVRDYYNKHLRGMVWKREFKAISHALLSVDMDHNCTRLNSFTLPKVPV